MTPERAVEQLKMCQDGLDQFLDACPETIGEMAVIQYVRDYAIAANAPPQIGEGLNRLLALMVNNYEAKHDDSDGNDDAE